MTKLKVMVLVAALGAAACSSASEEDLSSPGADTDAAEVRTGKKCKTSSVFEGDEITPSALADLLRGAGFRESEVPKMVCIAKYESRFFTGAHRVNANCTNDYGLYQVNDYWWLKTCDVSAEDLLDPATNVACAKMVRDNDPNHFRAWYAYRSHVSECDSYKIPK